LPSVDRLAVPRSLENQNRGVRGFLASHICPQRTRAYMGHGLFIFVRESRVKTVWPRVHGYPGLVGTNRRRTRGTHFTEDLCTMKTKPGPPAQVVTGDKSEISKTVQRNHEVVRTPNLGPQ